MRKDLWGIIEPIEGTSDVTPQKHQKALGIIPHNLGDEVLHHITGLRDAKKAWDELNQVFGTESKSSKINLLMQFYRFNKKGGESMASHINNFKALKHQLKSIKKEIAHNEAVAVLLNSIDKEPYNTLVSTLKEVDKSLSEIESSLLEHETKHKTTTTTSGQAVAFYDQKGRN